MLFPSRSPNLHRARWQSPLLLLSFPLFYSLSPLHRPSSLSLPTSFSDAHTRIGPPGLRCLSTRIRRKRNKTKSETAAQKETNKDHELLVQPPAGFLDDFFRSLRLRTLVDAHRQLLKAQRPTLQSRRRKPKTRLITTVEEQEKEEQRLAKQEEARYNKLVNLVGNKLLSLNIIVKMPAPKRKAEPETKYYAVRAGVKPGVYTNWTLCQQQITGFKGASFKSFTNYEDASAFAAGRPVASATSTSKPSKFYGVAVGRTPGVYTDWSIAQQEVVGWKNPKYKKFETHAEAEDFVRQWSGQPSSRAVKVPQVDETDEVQVIAIGPITKSSRKARKTGATQTAHEAQEALDATKPVIIYTDGSARGNGKVGAMAGVGVYFCGGFRE